MTPRFLRPFWRYYGGKWMSAPKYPPPMYSTIVEPFAGAAGYSLRHFQRGVILIEKFDILAEIWRYLIAVTATEIRMIPLVDHVDDLPGWVPQAARWLVGMTMNAGATRPNRRISAGMLKFRESGERTEGWCERMRERAATQVEHIRHWRVFEGDYTTAPDVEATWFIDSPYQRAGVHYVHHSRNIDYKALGAWCVSRRGQKIVCESDGADWLPFQPFGETTGVSGRRSSETVWLG